MRLKTLRTILAAFAAFGACAGAFGQMKNNDFTKADKSFDKSFEAEKKRPAEEKSRLNGESYDAQKFEPRKESQNTRDEKYRQPENPAADRYNREKFEKSEEKVAPPDRNVLREEWDKTKNNLNLPQKDEKMNKDYQGRSDFSKRHPRDAEMREFYEQIKERSMQDINKYMFRSSRSEEPGVPVSTAGGQIHDGDEEDASFLEDLVFGKKKTPRTSVSFKKNMDLGVTAPPSGPSKKTAAETPQPATKVLPPVVIGDSRKTNAPAEKKTTVYEQETDKVLMDEGESKNMKRGKTIIRVQVGDPKY